MVGPMPLQDTIACSDSTRQPILWVASVRPGRYQLFLRRTGYDRRSVLVDVAERRSDTVTVGLHDGTRGGGAEDRGMQGCAPKRIGSRF